MHDNRLDRALELLTELRVDVAAIKTETKSQTKIITHTCREVEVVRKVQAAHEQKDEVRFSGVENGLKWMKAIGTFLVLAVVSLFGAVFGWKVK